jgi:hypothetical protein
MELMFVPLCANADITQVIRADALCGCRFKQLTDTVVRDRSACSCGGKNGIFTSGVQLQLFGYFDGSLQKYASVSGINVKKHLHVLSL